LFFKERDTSPEYANVLEGNPLEKQAYVKSNLLDLMAELFLDYSLREFNKQKLYEDIDTALAKGDKKEFFELTNKYNKILNELIR